MDKINDTNLSNSFSSLSYRSDYCKSILNASPNHYFHRSCLSIGSNFEDLLKFLANYILCSFLINNDEHQVIGKNADSITCE